MGLMFISFCIGGSGSGGAGGGGPAYTPPRYDPPSYTPATDRGEGLYVHGTLNVRSSPNEDAAILRTLSRGDFVRMGPKDANGWAQVYSGGSPSGYAYRASDLVRYTAPAAIEPASTYSRPSSRSRGYIRGPRGGCYYINSSGNKQYVDRSECN